MLVQIEAKTSLNFKCGQKYPSLRCIGLPIYASDLGLSKLRFAVPAVALQPYLTIHLQVDFMVLFHSMGH